MMNLRPLAACLLAMILTTCSSTENVRMNIEEYTPFGVCYTKIEPEQVQNYDMVILEPEFYSHEEIAALKANGTHIIAYVSVGEVDENRWYYPLLKERGFLGVNRNWNSAYINLEDAQSRNVLLNRVMPQIMGKDVDGLFLDTIDAVAPSTGRAHLQTHMVQLIKDIHSRYPGKVIIQNSGAYILDKTRDLVDAFMTESLASNYDFSTGEYIVRPDSVYRKRLEYLTHHSEQNEVPFFILDFADTPEKRTQIYSRLDSLRRPFFISNIGLSNLPVQPKGYANNLKETENGL